MLQVREGLSDTLGRPEGVGRTEMIKEDGRGGKDGSLRLYLVVAGASNLVVLTAS